jgi:dTDP-4-dehydrorhamnose 3,5-epimerase
VKIITPTRHFDHRGFFSETYKRAVFEELGLSLDFVQENHSLTTYVGTVRGLHFQSSPFGQCKLVRVTRGSIFDVAVDIRRSSPAYGDHVAIELSASNWRQLLVPIGFAHGFCTLEPDTEVLYMVTAPYSPTHDHGLAWDDPALAIHWPVSSTRAILSAKDRQHPLLNILPAYFN